MSKFEILCVTMHQKDFSKIREMNIHTDVVFANQANYTGCEACEFENHRARMITTTTRGISTNRNIAIMNRHSDAEIVVFSDDDLRFREDCEALVLKEFRKHPEADAIKFNLNCISERKISMGEITHFHKAGRRETGGWGALVLAIKTSVLQEKNLWFNERFGTGTENYCGEDTIFIQELLKKGVKLYASPVCIADIDQSQSSWFRGYNERYFVTTGMVLHEIYPCLCVLLALRSAWRFSKRDNCDLRFSVILKYLFRGIRKNMKERKETAEKTGKQVML